MKRRPANVVEVRPGIVTSGEDRLTVETAWREIWIPAFAGMTTIVGWCGEQGWGDRPEAGPLRRLGTRRSLHDTRGYVTPEKAGVQPDR